MEIQVDPAVLASAAARYRQAANQVRDVQGRLTGAGHSLASPAVIGDIRTATEFDHVWSIWSSNLRELATALDNVASALETTLQAYTETDDEVVSRSGGPQ
ncbi:MAG TPA: WXG100 family type VII secretion target [Candidatus Dormibacteraeota bacterium]|nr:WXG100 family type VII secretion target [Candidatus Dormibacteraeota bacterium]